MNFIEPETLPIELRQAITHRNLEEGEELFTQGEAGNNIYAIARGRIKLVQNIDIEQSVTLQFLEFGSVLGEDALYEKFYNYTAIAQIRTCVLVYPKNVLQTTLIAHPRLAEYFRTLLAKKIRYCYQIIELRAIKSASQRILKYLHYLAEDSLSNEIIFDKSYKEVAAELDFTPETVSRTLALLEKQGSISRRRNHIKLQSPSVTVPELSLNYS